MNATIPPTNENVVGWNVPRLPLARAALPIRRRLLRGGLPSNSARLWPVRITKPTNTTKRLKSEESIWGLQISRTFTFRLAGWSSPVGGQKRLSNSAESLWERRLLLIPRLSDQTLSISTTCVLGIRSFREAFDDVYLVQFLFFPSIGTASGLKLRARQPSS